MTTHTPGPWHVEEGLSGPELTQVIGASAMGEDAESVSVADCYTTGDAEDEANAARIVACVNACAGMSHLPQGIVVRMREALEYYRSLGDLYSPQTEHAVRNLASEVLSELPADAEKADG